MILSPEQQRFLLAHRNCAIQSLLDWFSTQARNLPWRKSRTPYRVWVAEVILQQTQVATVRGYYERFMERFPTRDDLTAARLEEVLKLWEGLGYYSRARSLHRAAQEIVARFAGQLPANVADLRSLPGIGTYTAGAIASIAFGIPTPALLEAAVRLWLLEQTPGLDFRSGTFTEALIELGATLCRPKSPRCLLCPWHTFCQAQQQGPPQARKNIPHYDVVAAVTARADGHILIAQRRAADMLGGMWEFPGGKCETGETLPEALQRELQEEMGITIAVGEQLTVVKHAYTHFRITLYAFMSRLLSGAPRCIECDDFRWAPLDEIRALPMAVTDRKIAEELERSDFLSSITKIRPQSTPPTSK